jgi:pimeloyl-ACP methyl ester carboxylesterase
MIVPLLPLGDLVRLRRVESSDTRYAQSGDVHIAYRVFGAGPPDLVFASGLDFPSVEFHEEFSGEDFGELTDRMGVIRFDKRGTGASDRVSGVPSLEERMDDVRAVMDAAGVERAALLGHVDGAAMAILFAATYPERVVALVLFQGKPRFVRAPDFPWAPAREAYERETQLWLAELCDNAELMRAIARRVRKDISDPAVHGRARATRLTLSPAALLALRRMNMDVDVRGALSAVQMPTLIVHRTADLDDETDASAAEIARYMAAQIRDSRVVEVGRFDWMPFREIAEFVVEAWQRRAVERRRVLATVLFTDLVDSTAKAVEAGGEWPALLAEHNAAIRRELARFRGEAIDTAGDGFFASGFDGPARAIRDPRRGHVARPRDPGRAPHRRVRRRRREARRPGGGGRRARRGPGGGRRGSRLRHGQGHRRRLRHRLRRARRQGAEGARGMAALHGLGARRRRAGLAGVLIESREFVGDLEPGRLRADEDVLRRPDAREVDERAHRHVHVRAAPDDREEERPADPAAGVVGGVVAPNQEGVSSRHDLELLALDPRERLERGARPGAAVRAVAVLGVEELVRHAVEHGPALAPSVEHSAFH